MRTIHRRISRWALLAIAATCWMSSAAFMAHATSPPEEPDEQRIASSGPFHLWSVPQPTIDGMVATVIRIQAVEGYITGVTSLRVTGGASQTWFQEPYIGTLFLETPYREIVMEYPGRYNTPHDSYVTDTHLIPLCGITGDCEFVGPIGEQNDFSNPLGLGTFDFTTLDGWIDNYELRYGRGSLEMTGPDSGVRFDNDPLVFVDLLHIAATANSGGTASSEPVYLALEVSGIDRLGQPFTTTGRFGLDGSPLVVWNVPEPSAVVLASMALGGAWMMRRGWQRRKAMQTA
jgi:hypothetical protein